MTKLNALSNIPFLPLASRILAVAGMLAGTTLVVMGLHKYGYLQHTSDQGNYMLLGGIALFILSWILANQLVRPTLADEPPGEVEADEGRPAREFIGPVAFAFAGLGVLCGLEAFLLSGDGYFTKGNSFFWILGMVLFLGALIELRGQPGIEGLRAWWRWSIEPRPIRMETLLRLWPFAVLLGIVGVAAFFRLYHLDLIPREPFSDHAEKALDIQTVLSGKYPIFFERNTGREGSQIYAAAGLVKLGGMDFEFFTIKLATAIPSILVIPATYFMAREFFDNKKIALLAAIFTAVAFWPIALGRVGLRYAYGQIFVALTIAFVLRAVKYRRRNDFLLGGLCLGLGMYSYMAFRVMPVVVLAFLMLAIAVDTVQRRWKLDWRYVGNSIMLFLIGLIVYAPEGRYAITFRDKYWYRIITRGGSEEVPVEHPFTTFISNVRNGFLMFNWRGDVVWPLNIPFRPGLDYMMGALFLIGVTLLLVRWIVKRELPPALLVAAFLALLLPTVASISFPAENPAFGRASGLIPLVFVLVALPVYYIGAAVRRVLPQWWGAIPVLLMTAAVVAWTATITYNDYFDTYALEYRQTAHNVNEVTRPMKEFADEGPGIDNVFMKPYEFWLDTRLVALALGNLNWPGPLDKIEEIQRFEAEPGPKLIALHPEDTASIEWLQQEFPGGRLEYHRSEVSPDKDWVLFYTSGGTSAAGGATP